MPVSVNVQTVHPRKLAVVRREVLPGAVGAALGARCTRSKRRRARLPLRYNRMNEAHDGIRKWMAANRRESDGHSWEIYGDPAPDPADTETTVVYLLK